MNPLQRAAAAGNLINIDPAEALDLSQFTEAAGYLPVKAKRVRRVFRYLPVWYVGDPFRPRRALPGPRRAWQP